MRVALVNGRRHPLPGPLDPVSAGAHASRLPYDPLLAKGYQEAIVALAPGTVFAGFTIERTLGVGGMGTVYLARHPRLPRAEALKLLRPELSHDPDFAVRFAREADVAARLSRPNIVGVNDRGTEGGQLWISMPVHRWDGRRTGTG